MLVKLSQIDRKISGLIFNLLTRYDAAKTCPEPWVHVDKPAKVLKVKLCHLTQFALFWTFEAENGVVEFSKQLNGIDLRIT